MSDPSLQKENPIASQETYLESTISSRTNEVKSDKDFRIKPKMFLVYFAVIALAWGIRQAGGLDLGDYFSLVEEYPVIAPVLFVIIYALLVAMLIPTLPVNLAAGVLWGGIWGGILATLGSALGAVLAFLLARTSLGKPFAQKYDNRLMNWIIQQIDQNAWKVVAFVRLNPAFPSGPVNFIFGLTSINIATYSYATLLFLFPPSIGVALIGAEAGNILLQGKSLELLRILSMTLVGVLILLVGYWSGRSLLKKNQA
jgi:uncharacterized membrane protein YdjX (TVP38/TMEM64 family)